MKKLSVFTGLLFLGVVSAQPAAASGWSNVVKIGMLKVDASTNGTTINKPTILPEVGYTLGNPDGCTKSDKALLIPTWTQMEKMLSASVSAQLTGSDVKFLFVGCSTVGADTYPRIKQIIIL